MVNTFRERKDNLTVRYTKVSENSRNTAVLVQMSRYEKEGDEKMAVLNYIEARKIDLMNKGDGLRKQLQDFDFDLEDVLDKIIEQAKHVVENEIAIDDNEEKPNIVDVVHALYKDTMEAIAPMKEPEKQEIELERVPCYIEDGNLFLKYGSAEEMVSEYGWNRKDFKKQLISMGVLMDSKDRKGIVHVSKDIRKRRDQGWYLQIDLHKNPFCGIFEEDIVA